MENKSEGDLSKKAVLVLVMLAIVVSILSTTLTLNTLYNTNYASPVKAEPKAPPSAVATLSVEGDSISTGFDSATGRAVLIVK